MDAADLARWTRFAVKGGIGKCSALVDCVAQNVDDLMFLKDDEITVLMQLPNPNDAYLGYCEGVVGRFQGKDVHFRSKLKKPVLTKRSSVSSTRKTPTTPSPSTQTESPALSLLVGRRSRVSSDEDLTKRVYSTPVQSSGKEIILEKEEVKEVPAALRDDSTHLLNVLLEHKASLSFSSPDNFYTSVFQSQNNRTTDELARPFQIQSSVKGFPSTQSSQSPSASSIDPHSLTRKSSVSTFESIHSLYSEENLITDISHATQSLPVSRHSLSSSDSFHVLSTATTDHEVYRGSLHSSDGEVGIGLSLLRNLCTDVDDASSDSQLDVPLVSRQYTLEAEDFTNDHRPKISGELGRNGEMYKDDSGKMRRLALQNTESGHEDYYWLDDQLTGERHKTLDSNVSQISHSLSVKSSPSSSPSVEKMTFPPVAPLSPLRKDTETYIFPAPPTHMHRGSMSCPRRSASSSCIQPPPTIPAVERERRPSAASSATTRSWIGEDYDGASDIYDNYRYSHFSMGGSSSKASTIPGRNSNSSRRISTASRISFSSRGGSRPRMSSTAAADSPTGISDISGLLPYSPPTSWVPSSLGDGTDSSSSLGSNRRKRISSYPHFPLSPFPSRKEETRIVAEEDDLTRQKEESCKRPNSDSSIYTQSSLGKESSFGSDNSGSNPPSPVAASPPSTPHIRSSPLSVSATDVAPVTRITNQPAPLKLESSKVVQSDHDCSWSLPSPYDPPSTYMECCPRTGISEEHNPLNNEHNFGTLVGITSSDLNQATVKDRTCHEKMYNKVLESSKEDVREVINNGQGRFPDPSIHSLPCNMVESNEISESTSSTSQLRKYLSLHSVLSPVSPPSPIPARLPTPTGLASINIPPSPTYSRPSLHELRGGQGGETSGERRSLFLPHPNAPKAPDVYTAGPKYIQQQQPLPRQPPMLRGTAATAMTLALSRNHVNIRGPTIYGTTNYDLSFASGPVLITFSVDRPASVSSQRSANSPRENAISLPGSPELVMHTPSSAGHVDLSNAASGKQGLMPIKKAGAEFAVPRSNLEKSRPRSKSFSSSFNLDSQRLTDNHSRLIHSSTQLKRTSSLYCPMTGQESSTNSICPSPSTSKQGLLPQTTPKNNHVDVPPGSQIRTCFEPAIKLDRTSLTDSPSPMASAATSPVRTPFIDATSRLSDPDSYHSSSRRKRSLPNLRHIGKDDDSTAKADLTSSEKDTMQFQHMGFELVRPTLPGLQKPRFSKDSSVLSRDGIYDSLQLRTDSPSLSSQPSPGVHSNTNSIASAANMVTKMLEVPRGLDSELSMDLHRQREQRWVSIMNSTPPSQSRKSKKFKKLLYEGVPSSVRYQVWSHLTDGKARVVPNLYSQLRLRPRVPAATDIERDIQLYFRDHPQLRGEDGPIISLLHAYLTMVPDVQYATGLTLIAGHLLILAPEEDAFWIFVSIMDMHLRPYFGISTAQIEVDSSLFSRALEMSDPSLGKKLFGQLGILPSSICRPWFTSLFIGCLPQSHLDRVCDIFILEGVPFLLRVGLALVLCARKSIFECMSGEVLLRNLAFLPASVIPPNPEDFISLALSVKIKDDEIRKQRIKLEARVKRKTHAPRPPGSISLPQI